MAMIRVMVKKPSLEKLNILADHPSRLQSQEFRQLAPEADP